MNEDIAREKFATYEVADFDRAFLFWVKKKKVDKTLTNPLAEDLVIPVTEMTEINKFYRAADGRFMPCRTPIERLSHTKIFHCAGHMDIMYNLSLQGRSLYFYIILHLESGSEQIEINPENYMFKSRVKSSSYYKALKELIKESVIWKVENETNTFWINPTYLICGNRVKKYPDKLDRKGKF